MRTISLWRPWPWAIVHAGKRVENRDWEIKYRGDIVLHAAKKWDEDAVFFIQRNAMAAGIQVMCPGEKTMHPAGVLYAIATLTDCLPVAAFDADAEELDAVRRRALEQGAPIEQIERRMAFIRSQQRWAFGEYCWILDNIRPLAHVPWKGSQGIFDVPDHIVQEALRAA